MFSLRLQNRLKKKTGFNFKKTWQIYAMLIPPALMVFIFSYIPLYGLIIAFQDFNPAKGFFGSDFVGFKWFSAVMKMPDFKFILRNTVVIAIQKIVLGQIASIVFALLLNEIRQKLYKRTIQTITYFPHFLSWVIVGGIFKDLLMKNGMINQALGIAGIEPIFFLGSNVWFQPTIVWMEVWKEFGWGAILYLAAITNINVELYEAAVLDGANRIRQAWHITLPGISPTVILLAALSLGGILNAGFGQILVLYNPAVYKTADILDTFIYRQGLLGGQYSITTAIGLFQSVVGLTLILLTNYLARRFTNYQIF